MDDAVSVVVLVFAFVATYLDYFTQSRAGYRCLFFLMILSYGISSLSYISRLWTGGKLMVVILVK